MRLIEPQAGSVLVEGREVLGLDRKDLREMRKSVQMIFQDPFASLNPRMPSALPSSPASVSLSGACFLRVLARRLGMPIWVARSALFSWRRAVGSLPE